MAKQLVESMTAPFDPSRFRNTYQEKLMQLIQDKIAGKQIVLKAKKPSRRTSSISWTPCRPASRRATQGRRAEEARSGEETRAQAASA